MSFAPPPRKALLPRSPSRPGPSPDYDLTPEQRTSAESINQDMLQMEKVISAVQLNQDRVIPLSDLWMKLSNTSVSSDEVFNKQKELNQRAENIQKGIEAAQSHLANQMKTGNEFDILGQVTKDSTELSNSLSQLENRQNQLKNHVDSQLSEFEKKSKADISKAGNEVSKKLKEERKTYKSEIAAVQKSIAAKKLFEEQKTTQKVDGARKTFTAKMKKLIDQVGIEGTSESVRGWLVRVTNDYINEKVKSGKDKIAKQFKEVHIKYNKAILHLRGELEQVKNQLKASRIAEQHQEQGRAEDIKSELAHGIAHLNNYGIQALKNLREICNNVRDTVLEVKHDIPRYVNEGKIEQILMSANDSRNECRIGFNSILETNKSEIEHLEALFEEAKRLKSKSVSEVVASKTREFTRVCEQINAKQGEMQEIVGLLNADLTDLAKRVSQEAGMDILTLIEEEVEDDSSENN